MRVKEVPIRKLFEGKVSVRSYIVQEAIKENISLLLKLAKTDQTMLITPENLPKGRMTTPLFFESAYGDPPYYLLDFDWKPTFQLKFI